MAKTLLKNIHTLATMNDQRDEITNAAIVIQDNKIELIGSVDDVSHIHTDHVIDLSHHVLLHELINTHHHLYQSLTRAVPKAQDAELFGWLKTLYPIWGRITPPMLHASTQTAM